MGCYEFSLRNEDPSCQDDKREKTVKVKKPLAILHYVEAYGDAEVIRLALAVAEIPYKNDYLPMDRLDSAGAGSPLGQLPMLELSGKEFVGSLPALRYICQQFNFYPPLSDTYEVYRCEAISEFINSSRVVMLHAAREGGLKQGRAYREVGSVLEDLARELPSEGLYMVGGKLTMADLQCIDFLWNFFLSSLKYLAHEKKIPVRVLSYVKFLRTTHKALQEHLDSRPKYSF